MGYRKVTEISSNFVNIPVVSGVLNNLGKNWFIFLLLGTISVAMDLWLDGIDVT